MLGGGGPERTARPCVLAGVGSAGCERRMRTPRTAPVFLVRTRPKIPMSKAARLELLDALRYVMIGY